MDIRTELPANIIGIHRVNELAFEQPLEADIVDALRSAGAVVLSMVAVEGADIVGHILFSPVTVESDEGAFEAVGLGPMAVVPERQRRGTGSALVQAGVDALRKAGHEVVVVLGHPEYYPRFGFRRASEFGVRWEHDAPDEAFMVLELSPGALRGRGGVVRYRPEFNEA